MFDKINNNIFLHEKAKSLKTLSNNVYRLRKSNVEYYLTLEKNFENPNKLYGTVKRDAKRILNTYLDRNNNTGVLLLGLKGSGKTITAKQVCIDSNLPVIEIQDRFKGSDFIAFLNAITQRCIIFFDEFERIYEREDTEILSLLDGTGNSNKLFLLTCNTFSINDALKSRPGRIYYYLEYEHESIKTVKEVIDDLLIYKNFKQELIDVSRIYTISIDSLIALITEVNRYNESPKKCLEWLNIDKDRSIYYQCTLYKNGKKIISEQHRNIFEEIHFTYKNTYIVVSANEGYKYKIDKNVVIFTKDNMKIICLPIKEMYYGI